MVCVHARGKGTTTGWAILSRWSAGEKIPYTITMMKVVLVALGMMTKSIITTKISLET